MAVSRHSLEDWPFPTRQKSNAQLLGGGYATNELGNPSLGSLCCSLGSNINGDMLSNTQLPRMNVGLCYGSNWGTKFEGSLEEINPTLNQQRTKHELISYLISLQSFSWPTVDSPSYHPKRFAAESALAGSFPRRS